LYTYPDNFRAFKVLIAAEYSGAKVKTDNSFVFGETNVTKEFLAKFPSGKVSVYKKINNIRPKICLLKKPIMLQVPAFESNEGLCLFESNAIAYYVANDQLRGGKDAVALSQVLQWLNYADSDILPASCTWVFPCLGMMQFNKVSTERAKEDIKKAMSALNEHLLNHTYLVGERVTLADIVVACTMLSLYQNVLDAEFRYVQKNPLPCITLPSLSRTTTCKGPGDLRSSLLRSLCITLSRTMIYDPPCQGHVEVQQ
jgi:elongation factor 1-gamma